MYTIHILRQKTRIFLMLFTAINICLLVACGVGRSSTGAQPIPSLTPPIPSSTPTVGTIRAYGTIYGCPSDAVVSTAPAAANITIRPGQSRTPISVHIGDVIEIQMPFGVAWKEPSTSGGMLQLQSPSGYVWKPGNACIWRFVARNVGSEELTFSGTALCKKDILCTPSEVITTFTIKVG